VQLRLYNSDRGLNPMNSGEYSPQVGQRDHEPDRPVPTHAQVAGVIEEDNSCATRLIDRFT